MGSGPQQPNKDNPLDARGAGSSRLTHESLRFQIADWGFSPQPREEIRRHRAEPKHEVTLADTGHARFQGAATRRGILATRVNGRP